MGPALSRDYIGNLMPVSSIEALATTRLYEAWFEQKFWNDKFSIRAGQLAADAEFITSQYTDPFISGTYGWPAITAINLPSGGPSPPLAAMGARIKAIINDNFTLLAAVFDGNAAGPGTDDPQSRDRYGVNFRVNDPPFVIGEVQYAYNQEKTSKGSARHGEAWRLVSCRSVRRSAVCRRTVCRRPTRTLRRRRRS